MTHPPSNTREQMRDLIDRGSLGTPEAKALRASVSRETVDRVLARARELRNADHTDLSITEFLLARIAEDRADAELAIRNRRRGERWRHLVRGNDLHHTRWTPERVIAECDMKWQLLKEADYLLTRQPPSPVLAGYAGWLLSTMALPYAGHDDFREEWRP